MISKVVILMLISAIIVGIDFKQKRDKKKSLIAFVLFIYTFSILYAGMITRAIPPLFAIHLLLIILCWLATLIYIFKNRLYLWIYALPILNIAMLFLLNFLEGARYN